MYDDFRKAIEDLAKLSDKDRQYATVWLAVWGVLFMVRYAITGIVVFALGRRSFGAVAMALKESTSKEPGR